MDSARFLDSVRDPYARRQAPPSMALSGSLASGQSYYTVESLEGSSSLPPLKSGFGTSAPLPSDRDALLGLDARTRALIADREAVDARARLLAAEREALLRRTLPGGAPIERRAFADELAPVGSRPRFDGIRPLDELQSVDPRARGLGLDMRPPPPQDALRRGIDDRARAFAPLSGLAPDHRSEMIRARELAAIGGSSAAPFLPPSDYLPVRRDIADVRAPVLPPNPPFPRRDFSNRSISTFPRTERPARTGKQAPAPPRPAPSEAARKKTTVATNVKTPSAQPKTKPLSKESEGWCAVCEIDCFNIKNLTSHVSGKKHKAVAEGKLEKRKGRSDEGKPTAAATSQVEKKRAGDVKPDAALRATKRPKTSEPALGNGVPVKAADAKDGKMNEPKKEKAKANLPTKKDRKDLLSCEVCNVFTTGQLRLEEHLKGKRHAARVKELASSQVAK